MMHHYRNTQRALLALITGCLLLLLPTQGEAQKAAGKVNLLYGATTAPNAAVEFRLGKQFTLEIGGGGSLWAFDEDTRYKHWLLQPELRWWACDAIGREKKDIFSEVLCGKGVVVVDNDSLCTADEGHAVVSTYPDVTVRIGIDIGHAVRR